MVIDENGIYIPQGEPRTVSRIEPLSNSYIQRDDEIKRDSIGHRVHFSKRVIIDGVTINESESDLVRNSLGEWREQK